MKTHTSKLSSVIVLSALTLSACSIGSHGNKANISKAPSNKTSSTASTTTTAASASTTTTTASVSTTTTAAPTTTTTAAPTATPGPPRCHVSQLNIQRSNSAAVPGKAQITYTLTNISSQSCPIIGYPKISLWASNGTAVPIQVNDGAGPTFHLPAPSQVTLSPGGVASFYLGFSLGNGSNSCVTATTVGITPPNDSSTAKVTQLLAPCGPLYVSPIEPGANP